MTTQKELLTQQCASFMKKNKLKIFIKNRYSEYGNADIESQEVYLVPETFHNLRDNYKEQGILIGSY